MIASPPSKLALLTKCMTFLKTFENRVTHQIISYAKLCLSHGISMKFNKMPVLTHQKLHDSWVDHFHQETPYQF